MINTKVDRSYKSKGCCLFGCIGSVVASALLGIGLIVCTMTDNMVGNSEQGYRPEVTAFHDAKDFRLATGVTFPHVTPVDTFACEHHGLDFGYDETVMRFVAERGVPVAFRQRLDAACKTDTRHWSEEDGTYIYNEGRKLPLGNTRKTKETIWSNMRRAYGEKLANADSVWIEIKVPTDEDTIVVRYGCSWF